MRPPVEFSGPLPTIERGDHDYQKYKLIQLVRNLGRQSPVWRRLRLVGNDWE